MSLSHLQKFLLLLLLSGLLPLRVSAQTKLPSSSRLDFQSTLEAPAGRRGFLKVGSNGHFVWEDGRRARFWGINVSSTRLNIPKEQIDVVVRNFAKAGLNLVRLEAIDNRNCLLGKVDAPNSRTFDPQYHDRICYWMHALRQKGIYYYLDLLDFRTFKEGDGVLNAASLDRAARPYALYDRYLIELQKEFATQLLTHRNPYSGLRPVDDPALVLVEICNEHGFFLYPEKLETLVEPYRRDLLGRWNLWLRNRYPTREKLSAAWGKVGEFPALRDSEDPAQQTVDLPNLTPAGTLAGQNFADVRRAPVRIRDGVLFLSQIQQQYVKEMTAHLRKIGLKIPLTAVVSNDVIPDLASMAEVCDFLSENWYGENPREDPRTPGVRYYGDRNALREDRQLGFAPYTAALRWNNKPVVIREWAVSWPNRYRASSVPEALAYAAFQDYDAMLLFGYQTNRAPNGAEADALNDYAFQSDPTVWGLYAIAGQAFLTNAIRPAATEVTLIYPPFVRNDWPNRLSPLYRLAWSVGLHSATDRQIAVQNPKSRIQNTMNSDGDIVETARLRELLDEIGRRGSPLNGSSLDTHNWRTDTGEITRYTNEGRIEIDTPRLRVLAGEFKPGKIYGIGDNFRFQTPAACAAVVLYSLDGQTLERSQHYIVKIVSRAENSGQVLTRAAAGSIATYALGAPGRAPVLTFGRRSDVPVRVWFGRPPAGSTTPPDLLMLSMQDGSLELEVHNGRITLDCDTPNMAAVILGRAFRTEVGLVELIPGPARTTGSLKAAATMN